MKTLSIAAFSLCLVLASAPAAATQKGPGGYPNGPVTLIAPFSAGGSTDVAARMLANELSEKWSVPVIVENRPGGGGRIGANLAARAKPDGYTLTILSAGSGVILPILLQNKLNYSPADFAPLSLLVTSPPVLLVHPDSGINSTQELIERLKKNPAGYTYGTNGVASTQHMTAAVFLNRVGANEAVHVPYKGSAESLVGVGSGDLTFMFDNAVTALPFAQTGRAKALAVTSAERSPLAPNLPTLAESGLPGFDAVMWLGLSTQAAVPEDILDFLNESVVSVLKDPNFQKKLTEQSFVAAPMSRQEYAKFLDEEARKATQTIKDNNITIE